MTKNQVPTFCVIFFLSCKNVSDLLSTGLNSRGGDLIHFIQITHRYIIKTAVAPEGENMFYLPSRRALSVFRQGLLGGHLRKRLRTLIMDRCLQDKLFGGNSDKVAFYMKINRGNLFKLDVFRGEHGLNRGTEIEVDDSFLHRRGRQFFDFSIKTIRNGIAPIALLEFRTMKLVISILNKNFLVIVLTQKTELAKLNWYKVFFHFDVAEIILTPSDALLICCRQCIGIHRQCIHLRSNIFFD